MLLLEFPFRHLSLQPADGLVSCDASETVESADYGPILLDLDDGNRPPIAPSKSQASGGEGCGQIPGFPRRPDGGSRRRQVEAKARGTLAALRRHRTSRYRGRSCANQFCNIRTSHAKQMPHDCAAAARRCHRLAGVVLANAGNRFQTRKGCTHVQRTSVWPNVGNHKMPMRIGATLHGAWLAGVLHGNPRVGMSPQFVQDPLDCRVPLSLGPCRRRIYRNVMKSDGRASRQRQRPP